MSAAQDIQLTKNQDYWLRVYIDSAKPEQISGDSWDVSWDFCHGETRSSSSITFHLAIRRDSSGDRLYHTAIVVKKQQNGTICPVISRDHKTTHKTFAQKPDLRQVMAEYKREFPLDKRGAAASSSKTQGGNGGQGGGDGGSGNGQPPKQFEKKIETNIYGDKYFIDENGENIICDDAGNPIVQNDSKRNTCFYMDKHLFRHACTVTQVVHGASKISVMKTAKGAQHKCKMPGARVKDQSRWRERRARPQVNAAQGIKKTQPKATPGSHVMVNGKKHEVVNGKPRPQPVV